MSGIAARLATRRKALGLEQKQIAHKLGVSTSAISAWENGERTPRFDHAVAWARALGAEIEMTGA